MAKERQAPGIDIELGEHSYRVVPQRQARLLRRLFGPEGVFGSLDELTDELTENTSFSSLYEMVGGRMYEVLKVFIPDLMPRWEFDGYGSQGHADQDEYNEDMDRSPTHPELLEALDAAIKVNGLTWLRRLQNFFDPNLLRAQINATLARAATEARGRISTSPTSPSSPPPSGESAPTNSGMRDPTPPSADILVSPSPGSES